MVDDRMVGSSVDAALHGHSVLHSVTCRVAGIVTVPDLMSALVSLRSHRLLGIKGVRVRIGAVEGWHGSSLVNNCLGHGVWMWMVVVMSMMTLVAVDLDRSFLNY